MKWSDVISDPNLANQPYKVELKVQFYTANGEIERSSLIPGFPKQVNV